MIGAMPMLEGTPSGLSGLGLSGSGSAGSSNNRALVAAGGSGMHATAAHNGYSAHSLLLHNGGGNMYPTHAATTMDGHGGPTMQSLPPSMSLVSSSSPVPSSPPASLVHSNVYVAGIPHSWSKQQLDDFFGAFGTISESRILVDKITQQSRGIAFVRFNTVEAAKMAIQICHATTPPGTEHTRRHSERQ